MKEPLEVFFSYAHEDENYKNLLLKALSTLKRERLIREWHDRDISAGTKWATEIDAHLKSAHIILLLVSPDFIASDYCWDKEVKGAIERDDAGEACVIPIIVRPTDWRTTLFGKLQALPTEGKAITTWPNIDESVLRCRSRNQNSHQQRSSHFVRDARSST